MQSEESDNPFFEARWDTLYGAPPFDRIETSHYAPALDEAMRRQREEIDTIAQAAALPTFENTVEALERSGAMLERVENVFSNMCLSSVTDGLQRLQERYAPLLSEHDDAIFLNSDLFERVDSLVRAGDTLGLNQEQKKLLEHYHERFVRTGARLDGAAKDRLRWINARLAKLCTRFAARVRREEETYALVIEDAADLAGLPAEAVQNARTEAERRGLSEKWAFTLVRSSVTPFLQYAENRELRRQIHQAYVSRGANGGRRDTRALVLEIVGLRAERARLLGHASHAHYNIERNMAKHPDAVIELLRKLWKPALDTAKSEREVLQAALDADLGPGQRLQPWDWWYYTERVRKSLYQLTREQVAPYFELDRVLGGAFHTAERLFGVSFEEVTGGVPLYHPDVRAFDVKDAEGTHVGLFYVDYHARPGKRGGAWMNVFRMQSNLDGRTRPIVINVGNFPAADERGVVLLGFEEVRTLFHEFGHGLHGLLSDVTYMRLAGTRVRRDFVEFPSQLLENWALEPEVLAKYARHHETDEPIPSEYVETLQRAKQYNQGFAMTELVGAALLDLEWHLLDEETATSLDSVEAFERAAIEKHGFIDEVGPRYRSAHFQHIFTGDGYSAGYYVYLWAQVLEADAFEAFQRAGDVFHPELAQRLRDQVFCTGAAQDEMISYQRFLGRMPRVEALVAKQGLRA